MKCLKCGTDNIDSANFCNKCGESLKHIDISKPTDAEIKTTSANKLHNEQARRNKEAGCVMTIVKFLAALFILFVIFGIYAGSKDTKADKYQPKNQVVQQVANKPAPPVEKKENPVPVKIEDGVIRPNIIDESTLALAVRNVSNKTIDAYRVKVECKNNYGDKVSGFGVKEDYYGLSQETITPGNRNERGREWTLHGFDNATKFHVSVISVHFSDGSEWKPDSDNKAEIDLHR